MRTRVSSKSDRDTPLETDNPKTGPNVITTRPSLGAEIEALKMS